MPLNIFIGYDPREHEAYEIAKFSIERRVSEPVLIHPLYLETLKHVFPRRHQVTESGQLFCPISQAPMATEFAISRFVVPFLQTKGWALFMDCDMLCRADIAELFALRDPSKAVMVVKHKHKSGVDVKMDGQAQTYYRRKNWSSVVLWNCEHKAHHRLKYGDVLSLPGRDLHGFSWLKDDEIGSLPSHWNLLVGIEEGIGKIYHYTLGGPWFPNWAGGPLDHLWQFEKETYTKFHDIGRIQINGPLSEADAILLNPKKEYPPKSSGPSS